MAGPSVVCTKPPSSTSTHGENQEINNDFRRFEMVTDPSDHFYLSRNIEEKNENLFNHSSRVYKKIMQEWRILEKGLPDSIYVRVYENRIDLLRAVIVGSSGTPYHDGLYFFDIAFPLNYPFEPPLVYYKSFGLRINPNLYQNGKVCLSLLNTWHGLQTEKWNHKQSTILQVLISIQALVLNEKPYYNEPGMTINGKKSNKYNADTFIFSCKTMLYLLRNPPKNFEGFVASHFREKAIAILSACNAYINGQVRVGYYKNDGSCSSCSSVHDVSWSFESSIRTLYPELVKEFLKTGASLMENQISIQKKSTGFARRVFWKLIKCLDRRVEEEQEKGLL